MIGLINMGMKPGLIQRGKLGLRVFENRVLREMLGSNIKLNKNCIIRSFIIFTPHRILLLSLLCDPTEEEEMRGQATTHIG